MIKKKNPQILLKIFIFSGKELRWKISKDVTSKLDNSFSAKNFEQMPKAIV